MINPSSGLSHQTSVTSPPPEAFPKATHEEAAKIIGDVTQGKHVIVLSGYSELEYENPEAVKKIISECLDKLISEHGQDNLVVVAGATKVGIGMVYEIAAQKNLATLGIVSENGRAYGGIAPDCKNIAWVPAVDKNNWEVLTPQGTSYMVDVAKSNGTFCALGGGALPYQR
ncbi:MAG: hypothetical protein IT497_01535 [Ottowia sp.]|nr:hypothetical protein [Ottowia sp.]